MCAPRPDDGVAVRIRMRCANDELIVRKDEMRTCVRIGENRGQPLSEGATLLPSNHGRQRTREQALEGVRRRTRCDRGSLLDGPVPSWRGPINVLDGQAFQQGHQQGDPGSPCFPRLSAG